MEPGSTCVITHTKGQDGHSLGPVSPSSGFRPVWEVFSEPCAKGTALRMASPLAQCALPVLLLLGKCPLYRGWPLHRIRSSSEDRLAQHTCPLIQVPRGVKYRHPSGGWFPLCGVGCVSGASPQKVSAEQKSLILPPLLSLHNSITNSSGSSDDREMFLSFYIICMISAILCICHSAK